MVTCYTILIFYIIPHILPLFVFFFFVSGSNNRSEGPRQHIPLTNSEYFPNIGVI